MERFFHYGLKFNSSGRNCPNFLQGLGGRRETSKATLIKRDSIPI